MYNQCARCANTTLLGFQDQNGKVLLAKFEGGAWTTRQLDMEVVRGSGLALVPAYRAGKADAVLVFYQGERGNVSLAAWEPSKFFPPLFIKRKS